VFGDSFGVLTAFFSAMAFGGLIITIWQQQEELQLNRDEIREQHFENVLFRMLEIHNTIVSDLDIRRSNSGTLSFQGRDCFFRFYTHLKRNYDHSAPEELEGILNAYEIFWQRWQKDLGHYFRYLYNIFKHIEESGIENKSKYTNIVRAQLSDYELLILFYNCLYKHGVEKFKPLAEKYKLFDNLPSGLLLNESHKQFYHNKAYGE